MPGLYRWWILSIEIGFELCQVFLAFLKKVPDLGLDFGSPLFLRAYWSLCRRRSPKAADNHHPKFRRKNRTIQTSSAFALKK